MMEGPRKLGVSVGARHGVVHEGSRLQLPIGVVARILHHRLADPLHDAAMNLALH